MSRPAAVNAALPTQIRNLLRSKDADRLFPKYSERSAVAAFYQSRSFTALWIERGQLSARAREVQALLSNAEQEGLDATDYRFAASAFFLGICGTVHAMTDETVKVTSTNPSETPTATVAIQATDANNKPVGKPQTIAVSKGKPSAT
jgi:murein L,D-transpeptidase YcbB/YkuD